jgi:hypothetical protein
MISPVDQKLAIAALDRPESFAALTRAHTGFAKLRPPRFHNKQPSEISSPPPAMPQPSQRGAFRIAARGCVRALISSLRAKRSNPESVHPPLDCFVALLLAMTRFESGQLDDLAYALPTTSEANP